MPEINFGYEENNSVNPNSNSSIEEPKQNLETGKEGKFDSNGNPIEDITNKNKESNANEEPKNTNDGNNNFHEYAEGTTLEVDGVKYTINNKGDVVDADGNVFKEAADVKEWIKSFEVTEEEPEKELSINNISKALDIEIIGDDGKPVVYENTPDGIKSYVADVIESGRQEVMEGTINAFYEKFPFVKPMVDYYISNGNSLEGYNQVSDRSNITIDESNEAQQENIIRTAWKEENRRGNVDSYIAYLKSQGTLASTAKEELEALIEKDKAYKEQLENDAKAAQQRQIEEAEKYWNGVKQVIDSRKIAGYEIPEVITVERNGKKLNLTSNDFFNYLYRTDKDGLSDYAKDVQSTKPEDALQDEILRAYLKFTGGTYADLIKIAINEEKVKNLKLQSKAAKSAGTIRITTPKPAENNNKESFGY